MVYPRVIFIFEINMGVTGFDLVREFIRSALQVAVKHNFFKLTDNLSKFTVSENNASNVLSLIANEAKVETEMLQEVELAA